MLTIQTMPQNSNINSSLQMLIQNIDFCKIILENFNKSENLENMANLIKEYYTTTNYTITPNKIKEIVGNKNKIFCQFVILLIRFFFVFFNIN